MIGKTFGHYQITEKLGEGGMGVVYKARDTRLERYVAIKVLPPAKVSDPGRKARFRSEAKAASALNHPNIVTIYDIGQADGVDFIAMECVAGKTLDALTPAKGLQLSHALKYAVQMADALTRAHGAGIIHRDLKPSNVMVDEHGLVKVLDFGLAKLTEAAAVSAEDSTITVQPSTETGLIVGTVSYMSPEQAEGKKVDARSDIFSFGTVLYEMVTGRRAFQGDSAISTLAALLTKEPAPFGSEIPYELERIVTRCLRKDPERRFQDMADVKVALSELKEQSESSAAPSATARIGCTRPGVHGLVERARSHPRALVLAVATLVMTAAVLGIVLWPRGSKVGANRLFENVQVSQVTATGNAWRPALSPDGKFAVYVRRDGEDRSLRIRQLGTDRDLEIVAAQPGLNIQAATVTPDGRFVDFVRGKSGAMTLWRMPFLGGAPKRVIDNVNSAVGWSPDGRQFAFIRAGFDGSSALLVANAEGTNERTLATRKLPAQFLSFDSRGTPSGQGSGICPSWSSDARTLAIIGFEPVAGVRTRQAVFVDVTSGAERAIPLLNGSSADGIEWLDSGRLLLSLLGPNDAVSQFWVLSYPKAEWSRLTNDLSNYASFSISADRRSVAAARWDYRVGISVLENGSSQPTVKVAPTPFVGVDLSWAGERLLYAVLSPADNVPAVWALGRGQSDPEELIANASSPAAAANGQTIVFSRVKNGRLSMWRANGDGREAVPVGASASARVNLTSDGKQVVFLSLDSGVQSAWIMSLDGGKPRQLTNVYTFQPVPSPDGKSLAFVSVDEKRQSLISICAISDCSSTRNLPVPRRPLAMQWTPDGRGLAYSLGSNIWVQKLDDTAPHQLTHFPEDDHRIEDFAWSPDGKRLAFSRSRTTWDLVLFRGLKLD